jgi:uncharacterized membrane protein
MENEREIQKIINSNRTVLRWSGRWLPLALWFFGIYTGLALAAPVLMRMGAEGPANVLYKVYSPLCHQFAFRSWFMFGEQSAYPREVSEANSGTFEEYASRDPYFRDIDLTQWTADLQLRSREFKGNKEMGYKTALCERDVAIYATMFLAGLAYTLVRGKLRPVPFWLYLLLGVGPIGLDGFSQMLSYPPFDLWPVRETLPAFRILTGAMFGLMNVWLAFPYLEMSMSESMRTARNRIEIGEERLRELHK